MKKITSYMFSARIGRFLMMLGVVIIGFSSLSAQSTSTRKDRRLINAGNSLYKEQKFADAKVKYREALQANSGSAVARFNLALCNAKLAALNKDNDSIASRLLAESAEGFTEVARLGRDKAELASKANYNLGNMRFESEDYQGAIQLYKQALRLNPGFNEARRNLRIAQLKLQQNQDNKDNKDDKQDQNKDQQDKQDKQDQNKDQQDQQQDQQQNQDQKNDQQNQQPKDNELSPQVAEQILNAVENNEQHARQANNKGEKAKGGNARLKKW